MIRTLRDEVERYGHYSLAAESMYDHPFQWGSKRTGPGPRPRRRQILRPMAGRAPDRSALGRCRRASCRAIPGSPTAKLDDGRTSPRASRRCRLVGVPYSDEMIEKARPTWPPRSIPTAGPRASCSRRYPRPRSAKFDGKPGTEPSELDALVAYLQMLGTLVDFATFDRPPRASQHRAEEPAKSDDLRHCRDLQPSQLR